MCPKERHLPPNARTTTIGLTAVDKLVIQFIREARRDRGIRSTMNDVMIDGLWEIAGKEGFTRDGIQAMMPPKPKQEPAIQGKIAEMPKKRRSRVSGMKDSEGILKTKAEE